MRIWLRLLVPDKNSCNFDCDDQNRQQSQRAWISVGTAFPYLAQVTPLSLEWKTPAPVPAKIFPEEFNAKS